MTRVVLSFALAMLLAIAPAVAADRISIDARDTDLGDVIRLIGIEAGWNIVPDASVKPQRITFRLHDVDAETALEALATAYGLTVRRDHGIVMLSANDPHAPRADATSAPAATAAIDVHNEKPTDVVKALKGVLPETAAIADDRSNSVILAGSDASIAQARTLLAGLDRPGRQVMFEVKVTDVQPNNDAGNVGVEFGGASFGSGALAQFPYALTKSAVVVNAQLNALVQTGHAQILATPRIATLNNKEASLLVGEQYPVVTVNQQTGFPSVQTIDVGVQLRVTPTIGDDGVITADLHPAYSQIIGFNANFPIIANRKIDATLRVRDGETIVLGGLFEDTSSETISKLPWLADLPVLGGFFRNKQSSHVRDEVVFLITPHILQTGPG
jgi:type II secretory pathway component GspD/PulD (secretin)